MTDAECAEILAEYRKLRLGPELSAAMDHAIEVLTSDPVDEYAARRNADEA